MSEITLNSLPKTLDELKAMPQAALTVPEEVAALTVAALALYPENPAETEKIHIERFGTVAPAGGHRQRCRNILGREPLCHAGRLGTTANRRTADHALHRRTIGVLEVLRNQLGGIFCHRGNEQGLPADGRPYPVSRNPHPMYQILSCQMYPPFE